MLSKKSMSANYEAFLGQQNDRLKFYNGDFWEAAKFFSALALLLLSGPFAIWMKDSRPTNWTLIASAPPLLAIFVSYVAYKLLKRTAKSYYEVGASVVVLERLLKLHHFEVAEQSTQLPIVSRHRIEQGLKSTEDLASDFKGRLDGVFGHSRMSVVLALFVAYMFIATLEVIVLLMHGILGISLVGLLKACLKWI